MNQENAKASIPAALQGVIHTKLFIDGKFVDAESGATMATLNPHDNSEIAQVAMAGQADIDKAILAAQRAFPKWSRMAAMDRGRILLKLADLIEANAEQLAQLESLDTGHPIRDSRILDVPRTAVTYRYFGGMADKFQGDVVPVEAGFLNYVSREALGVVGQVVPWQHGGNEAGRDYAAVVVADCRADAGGRHARRCGQHGARFGQCRGAVHRRASRYCQDRFYRIDGDRSAHRAGLGRQSEKSAA